MICGKCKREIEGKIHLRPLGSDKVIVLCNGCLPTFKGIKK